MSQMHHFIGGQAMRPFVAKRFRLFKLNFQPACLYWNKYCTARGACRHLESLITEESERNSTVWDVWTERGRPAMSWTLVQPL